MPDPIKKEPVQSNPIKNSSQTKPNSTSEDLSSGKDIEELAKKYAEELDKKDNEEGVVKIPYKLRFPLAWTLFWAIIGIIIQSISNSRLELFNFFGKTFISWIYSLGNFTRVRVYTSVQELISNLASGWYYFLFTAGLLSILWGLISLLLETRLRTKAPQKL